MQLKRKRNPWHHVNKESRKEKEKGDDFMLLHTGCFQGVFYWNLWVWSQSEPSTGSDQGVRCENPRQDPLVRKHPRSWGWVWVDSPSSPKGSVTFQHGGEAHSASFPPQRDPPELVTFPTVQISPHLEVTMARAWTRKVLVFMKSHVSQTKCTLWWHPSQSQSA